MSEFFEDYKNLISSINNMTKSKEGYGYKYVELTPLLEEVLPKIHENNFILIQTPKRIEGEYIRNISQPAIHEDKKQNIREIDGVLTKEIKIPAFVLHSRLIHESGQEIESDLPLFCDDVDPQAFGSSETYARRYSIYALLHIKTQDDDGLNASPKGKENAKAQENKDSLPENVQEIATFLARCENPTLYYWDVKNRKDIDDNTKRKLISIIYPK